MKRIGLFPGTFDPITIGHLDIIDRSLPLFDKLVIGIGRNVNKEPMFSVEKRLAWVREIYKDNPKVDAVVYDGLTIRCCQQVGARFILRGIRYVNDFEYEKAIADMNRSLDKNIETLFLTCLPQYTSVASTPGQGCLAQRRRCHAIPAGSSGPFLKPQQIALMPIWYHRELTLEGVQSRGENTMAQHLGIEFTEIGENFLKARMPVDDRTRQPYGLLHGGASAALAETLGSVGSAFVIDPDQFICVGLEINANHIRGVQEGHVYGTAIALHLGQTTHVWDIRIHDDQEKLVCVSRQTVAILKRR